MKQKINSVLFMSLGCLLMSAGVYFFKIPNGFVTGGIAGIGTLLGKITPVSPASWIWILNILLMLMGFLILGKENGIKTFYCSMLYSALTYMFEAFFPLTAPLTDQPFLELTYAMLLTAMGSAVIFYCNASAGGTDIVALILKKYTRLNVGKALLAVDFTVAASSFCIFGIKIGLYSLLGLFAKAFLVDGIIDSLSSCKYFIVITSEGEKITEYIMETLRHGVTAHKVTGEYTHEEKTMIHTVCKRIEAIKLKVKIKEIDPHAFTIISTSSEIIGRGFRSV